MACPDCFKGALNGEAPTGSISTIHGLPTYIARPENKPKGLVVIIPDAFGWDTPNNQVLADRYAKAGDFLVYAPDFMRGHSCPIAAMSLMQSITAPADWFTTLVYKPYWIAQAVGMFVPFLFWCRQSVTRPIILDFFRNLRTSPETSNMKIGAAGFCWGGKHTILLTHDTPSSRVHRAGSELGQIQPLIDCGFTAHPSFVKVPSDIENVRLPLSISVGDNDSAFGPKLVEQTQTILEKKHSGDSEIVVIPGAKHGFAVRGLLSDPEQKEHGEKAEQQAVAWFTKHLS